MSVEILGTTGISAIQDGVVTEGKIATGAVTNAKIGNSAVDSNKIIDYGVGWVDLPIGTILQSVFATSGFTNQTIVSTTPVALSGLSVTITPKFSNSKIIIHGMVSASWTYVASLHIYKNGSELIPSHGGNSQSSGDTALFTHYQSSQEGGRAQQIFPFPVLYVDSPNTTNSITYDFRANSGWSGGTETFYFNNRISLDMLSSSWILVQEVKV